MKCKICRNEFYTKPSWLKKGSGIYCSIKCRGLGKRNGKLISCHICKKKVYKSLKAIKNSKSGKLFCNRACSLQWLCGLTIGQGHGNWKGGQYAYKNILKRQKLPYRCTLCLKNDKRILVVHHIDQNRKNNNPENLTWLCYNCHFLVHNYLKIKYKFDAIR